MLQARPAALSVLACFVAVLACAGCRRDPHAPQGLSATALGETAEIGGHAAGYAEMALGAGEIELVGKSQRFPVGTIDTDGRFRIHLPGDVGFPGVEDPRGEAWSSFIAPVDQIVGPQQWGKVEAEPAGLRLASFSLAYRSRDRYSRRSGEIMLTDTDPDRRTRAGEMAVIWLWADRDGRLDGEAQVYDGQYNLVMSPWKIDVRRGWNLVASRALGYRRSTGQDSDVDFGRLRWRAWDRWQQSLEAANRGRRR